VTLDAFQQPRNSGSFGMRVGIDIARLMDDRRLSESKPQRRRAPELLILTNLTGGYGLGWDRRRVLISGGGPATSLGWQHLTAGRASAAFD
jgi:hypothetical protein